MKWFACLANSTVAVVAFLVGGCATITTGTTQPIAVETDPPGADCTLKREGTVLGKVTTPGSVTIKRAGPPLVVACKKDGYEDARAVMNSQEEKATIANAIIGGWVGMMIDQSSGANSRYQPSVRVELTAMSESTRNYVAERARQPAVNEKPAPTATMASAQQASAASPASGPYDGAYTGSVAVLQTNVNPPIPHMRQFDVRVVNGVGIGTVKHALCDEPGEVFFVIDTAGSIKGKANTRNTVGCTERMAMVEGRMNGPDMRLTLRLRDNPELVMTRQQGTSPAIVTAASAALPSGPNDGDYSGGLELGSGDLRQVWLRVVGTKGTGNIRHASCPQPGLISVSIAADGAVTGEADLLNGPACAPKKATVKGRLSGRQMAVNLAFEDGQISREFIFTRRSKGFGVDD